MATRTLKIHEIISFDQFLKVRAFNGSPLTIHPHDITEELTANYSEDKKGSWFYTYKFEGKDIVIAQSPDAVCHEAGHAVSDGFKQLYNESF
jgi:hypothetical protein